MMMTMTMRMMMVMTTMMMMAMAMMTMISGKQVWVKHIFWVLWVDFDVYMLLFRVVFPLPSMHRAHV
jgi:hypothetical protein